MKKNGLLRRKGRMCIETLDKMAGWSQNDGTRFDLGLFLALNEAYKDKPIVPHPPRLDEDSLLAAARRAAADLEQRVGLRGRRVLEVGCGAGYLGFVLAAEYGCRVVGVDIKAYAQWADHQHSNLERMVFDIGERALPIEEQFDRIVSRAVWEHMQHPFSALRSCRALLAPEGLFSLYANLYRSPVASHRYREVFFPWPHLLFSDAVFAEFYAHIGKRPGGAAWLNKLTYAQYLFYFDALGFDVESERLHRRPFDEAFYARFEDTLSRYPVFDLMHDFFTVVLRRRASFDETQLRALDAREFSCRSVCEQRRKRDAVAERIAREIGPRLGVDASPEAVVNRLVRMLNSRSGRAAVCLGERPRDARGWLKLSGRLLRILATPSQR